MSRARALVSLLAILTTALACASGGGEGGGGEAAGGDYPKGYSAPPAGSKLAQVQVGMNDAEVRNLLGNPTNANDYITGKGFIPYYYGPDTARSDWMYKGEGRVVFSRNRYSGGLKVIRVMYNPSEP